MLSAGCWWLDFRVDVLGASVVYLSPLSEHASWTRLGSQVNSGAFGEAWVPDDLNGGHLELYFLLLAGFVAVRYEIS